MYGSYDKGKVFSAATNDASIAKITALNYNQAIGVIASTWMMPEPFCVARLSIQAITAIVLTTAATVSLFRRAKVAIPNSGASDDTSTAAAFMTDTTEAFTVNEFVGWTIYNITNGSSGIITANAATTVTAAMYLDSDGTTADTWDSGDTYEIGYKIAELTIPIGTTALGDVIFKDVDNVPSPVGSGLTATYMNRGVADIHAGEQLAIFTTGTLGAGSAGTYQPYVFGHHMAEVAGNQTAMTATT